MNKIIIFGIVFLVLISFASAYSQCGNYYKNNSVELTSLTVSDEFDGSSFNSTKWYVSPTASTSCGGGQCNVTSSYVLNKSGAGFSNANTTCEIRFKTTAGWNTNGEIFLKQNNTNIYKLAVMSDYGASTRVDFSDNLGARTPTGFNFTLNNWNTYSLYALNDTNMVLSNGSNIFGYNGSGFAGSTRWGFGTGISGDKIQVDYFICYAGTECPLSDLLPPIISFQYPAQATTYNNYNGTLYFTTNINSNCSINRTEWILNDTDGATGHLYYNPAYAFLADGTYYIDVMCNNSLNSSLQSSSILNFTIDTTSPDIYSSLSANISIFLNNLSAQFNFSDNILLWSVNITTPEGYNFNASALNVSTYQYNISIDLSSYAVGNHNITACAADAHTAEKLKNQWEASTGTPLAKTLKLDVNGKEAIRITAKNPSHFESISIERKNDRLTDKWVKQNEYKGKEEAFIVSSDYKIEIVGNDLYQGWMVIPEIGIWRDFETEDKKPARVKRISDNEVEVTTDGEEFHSTGELNINCETYNYYKYNYTVSFTTPTVENRDENIYLILNVTNVINTSLVNGNLNYNNTWQNDTAETISGSVITLHKSIVTPNIASGSNNILFYWNYTLGNGFYFTGNYTQAVNDVYIDTCGGITNTTMLNITITDEINNNTIASNINSEFIVWTQNFEYANNFTFNHSGVSSVKYCVYPTWVDYNINALFQYYAADYTTNTYYLVNETLNNITRYETVYLLSSANATGIGVYLTDTTDDELEGYYGYLQRKDFAANTYKTTSVVKFDADGLGRFNLELYDTFYKWVWKSPTGQVVGATSDNIIKLTTLYYQLSIDTNYFQKYEDVLELVGDLDIDNTTGTVTFTYSDSSSSSIEQYCLRVRKSGTITDETLSEQCSASKIGTLAYTFPDLTGGTYFAQAYAVATGSTIMYPLDHDEVTYGSLYRTSGKVGLFAVALWTMSLSLVGGMLLGIAGIPIFAVIGLASGVIIKLISIKWEVLISLFIVAGVLAWKIKR